MEKPKSVIQREKAINELSKEPDREFQVDYQIRCLADNVNGLEKAVIVLEDRLSMVLSPGEKDKSDHNLDPAISLVPLAEKLGKSNDSLSLSLRRLRSIVERIEL